MSDNEPFDGGEHSGGYSINTLDLFASGLGDEILLVLLFRRW